MTRRHAFTLIELLIVVAIIAILAAIAVPNFLEAQTRARISRVHADLRTLATALEAYAVDNNKYSLAWHQLAPASQETSWKAPSEAIAIQYGLSRLTTPVSYITAIPLDPFRSRGQLTKSGVSLVNDPSYKWYSFAPTWHTRRAYLWQVMELCARDGVDWIAQSVGPGRDNNGVLIFYVVSGFISWMPANEGISTPGRVRFPYDPTNGTVSSGWVIRTNQGIFTKPQRGWW